MKGSGSRRCVKPLGRYLQAGESAVGKRSKKHKKPYKNWLTYKKRLSLQIKCA
jgi:hypothetical protein